MKTNTIIVVLVAVLAIGAVMVIAMTDDNKPVDTENVQGEFQITNMPEGAPPSEPVQDVSPVVENVVVPTFPQTGSQPS
jgi:hypothetical protein